MQLIHARNGGMGRGIVLFLGFSCSLSSAFGSSYDVARKALAVIEIASQQDLWYARFLKGFLSLPHYSDDTTWDLALIAHMALTQSAAIGKPLPLPEYTQHELLELFVGSLSTQTTFSSDMVRCAHNTTAVPHAPIANPGRCPDTCVCYDLYVKNQAFINSLTVINNETVGGSLTVTGSTTLSSLLVTGSVTIGGTIIITGTPVFNNLVVENNELIGNNLLVGGSEVIDGNLSVGGSFNIAGPVTFANLTVTGTGTFGALSVLSTATIAGSLTVDGLIYQPGQTIPPNNVAYVQKSRITAPNEFNSIHAALAAIALLPPPSAINPYLIHVTPGVFVENQLQLAPYITLAGSGAICTVIQAATPNQNVLVGAGNTIVRDVTITGATGLGFAGLLHNTGGSCIILDSYFGNNNIHVNIANVIPNAVALERCLFTPLSQFAQGVVVQGQTGVGAVMDTVLWSPIMNALYQSFATTMGPGSFLQINNSTIGSGTISPVLTGTAIMVQNGAFLRATGTLIGGFSEAIGTIAAGAAPKLLLSSVVGQNNTLDLVVQHPQTFGSVDAIFSGDKTVIDPNSPLAVFLVDPIDGNILTEGHTQWGPTFPLVTDIYYQLNQGWNTGVMSGGSLLFSPTSLVITATAGIGYIMNQVPTPLHLQMLSWSTQSTALPPLTESFLYIDQNATLQSSVAQPANEYTILLGKAYTTTAGVLFAQEFFPDAQHTGERLTSAIENSLGVIYISGSLVSSTTANQLNVGTGSYVFGTQQYAPLGGSPISFSTWMLTGTGGGYMLSNPAVPVTNVVDTLEWDSGNGSLSFIPTGSVTKHVLYISGDGPYEHYMLQYGQQLFNTVVDAQNGAIPPQPSIWTGDIAHIATVIVGPAGATVGSSTLSSILTSTGTIYSLQDIRPIPSFKGTTISGVTVHGDLSGLLADDHPQYLLVNGMRAMAGDLNMNGNNIIMNNGSNYGLVDGVLVHQHGSRHLPLGQDPIATAAPVNIGTTNFIGIANSLAQSDHVHAHGNLPGGTLHAEATESTDGFMSAADKRLLDTLVRTTYLFIMQGGNSFGAPIVMGTNDNNAVNIEANGTTWLTIAPTGTVTLESLSTGVVQASSTGLLSSSAGANGQLLIGTGISSSPVWANITSNNNTIKITNGAGTIDLATTGSAATSYVTNNGTAVPASGVVNVFGGSNITTSTTGPATVAVSLVNSPVIPGNLTVTGNEVTGGTLTVTGSTTLSALTVTGGTNLGATTALSLGVVNNGTVGGTLQVTGATTLSSLGTGVVQASSTGLLSSSAGANGQLLIGTGISSSPVWANLTSNNNTIKITNGAGTIDLATTGSAATSYVTNNGTAVPASGVLNVFGGSNITTSTTGPATVTVSLVNSPVIPGNLTVTGNEVVGGTLTVTGSTTLSALTVTGGTNLGATTASSLGVVNNETVGGTLQVTGATTLSSLGTGVVQASSTGFLSSSAGANGQLLIGTGISSSPVWANLTSNNNTIKITNGAGTIDLATTGSAATAYVTNNGTAVPASGVLNVFGGSNITTSTTGPATVTISLINSPSIPGSLTVTGNEVTGGTLTVTGSTTLSALTVSGGTNLGATTASSLGVVNNETVGGTLQVTGATTLSSLGTGVVQASSTGLLSSSAGANGQLLIGTGISSSPVWANITSNNNTIKITNGAGTIDLATTGSAATSYVTNNGTAVPASGVLNVFGGSNITTSTTGPATVTVSLVNSPVIPGNLTVTGNEVVGGTLTVTGSTTLSALTVTGGTNLGVTTASSLGVVNNETVGGTLQVTGATTLSSLGTGVVQASSTGLLSSSAGANGQLLIGTGISSSPVWANITSNNNTIKITNGAGTIDLATTGSAATSYVTNNGTAVPGSGVLNVFGGSNITTSTTGSATIAISVSGTTNNAVQIGNAGGSLISIGVGTTGQVLIGSTGAAPAFNALGVNSGLTAHSLVVAEGNSAFVALGAATNGQIPIGSTGADPVLNAITSNNNTIKITNGAGTIDLATTGSAATSYVTNNGTAVPGSGVLNVFGGSNITTSTTGPATVTVSLVNSPAVSGSLTAGTVVVAAAGSAGAPSHTFTGNTTSGMYSPGTNQLGLATSGTSGLTINSAGALQVPNLSVAVTSTSGSVHTDISGNLTAFANIYCSSFSNTTQSVPDTTATSVSYNTDGLTVGNITHPDISGGVWTQFAVPTGGAGFYIVSASTTFTAIPATTTFQGFFLVNGSATTRYGAIEYTSTTIGIINRINNTALIYLNAGDYVQMVVSQTSGGALNIGNASSASYNRLQMARIM